jgi:3-oxoadipate CoA-transferase beta subunit
VKRVYTDLAVIDLATGSAVVLQVVDGLSFDDLQARTGFPLHRP